MSIKASELSLKIYNAMLQLEVAQAELSMFQFHEASETLVTVKRELIGCHEMSIKQVPQ